MIDAEYFMDKMQEWEIMEFYNLAAYHDVNSWEQTRLICYLIGKGMFKGIKTSRDIVKFAWDVEDELHETMTRDEFEQMKALSKNIKLNNKANG